MEPISRYHLYAMQDLGGDPQTLVLANQDRQLARMVEQQVDRLRSGRSRYLPLPQTADPIFIVG